MTEQEREALIAGISDLVNAYDDEHDAHEETPDWEAPQEVPTELEVWELTKLSYGPELCL